MMKQLVLVFIVMIAGLLMVLSMRLLLLKRDVAQYRDYWTKRAQTVNANSAHTYVVLGDSTAQAIGASSPEKGYVGRLAAELEAKTNQPVKVINFSVSGAKVQDVLNQQLPKLLGMSIDDDTIVTLSVGANDMRSFDDETFRAQMEELLSQLPPQTIVADIPYFGGGRYASHEKNAKRASVIIEQLATKYGLRIAPLHLVTQHRDQWRNYAADFFHPSDKGYENWYQAFIGAGLLPGTQPLFHPKGTFHAE